MTTPRCGFSAKTGVLTGFRRLGMTLRRTARLCRARLWTLRASRHAGLEGGIDGWL